MTSGPPRDGADRDGDVFEPSVFRFGFALPIWFEEGRASWDPSTGWKPEWAEAAATRLCYNTFEEAWWTVGLPRRIVCDPDDDAVTWLNLTVG